MKQTIALTALLSLAFTLAANDWQNWRGPNYNGATNRLNDAISCPSCGAEHWGQLANGLMVSAVDAKRGPTETLAHQRAGLDLDGVREFVGLAFDLVLHGLRPFGGDVGNEPAT